MSQLSHKHMMQLGTRMICVEVYQRTKVRFVQRISSATPSIASLWFIRLLRKLAPIARGIVESNKDISRINEEGTLKYSAL